jgi:N12 class adenine-specific DNA methylase
VLPGDIDANLGAPWIPETDIRDFAGHLFGVEPDSITVAHLKKDAVWSVDAGCAAKSEYGTARANGTWLLELALNMKTPVVYDPDPADPDKRVVNQEETLAAREKQKTIKERFRSWVLADPERTELLVRLYNDTFNATRRAEDIGGQELSYAEVKAIASGNSAVLTLAEADAELQRLAVLRKSHMDEQYLARRNLRDLPVNIERLTQRLAGLTTDQATMKTNDDITIGGRATGDPWANEEVRPLFDE